MMATVPHVTSGLGLRKFQTDGFLLDRVYKWEESCCLCTFSRHSILLPNFPLLKQSEIY